MDKSFQEISLILRIPSQFRTSLHIEYLMRLTQDIQFFTKISAEQKSNDVHKECCKVMNLEEYNTDDFIFHFGDKGEKFYIILTGSVSVKIPAKKKVLVTKSAVNKIENFLEASNLKTNESEEEDLETFPSYKKEGNVILNVNEVMNSLKFSSQVTEKEDDRKVILSNEEKNLLNLFKSKVKQEQRILMSTIKHSEAETLELEFDDFNEVGILSVGGAFGELALISDGPRSATIQVREKSSFLVLSKKSFTQILGGIAEKRVNSLIQFLNKVPYFRSRSKAALMRLTYFFQARRFKKDQKIYKEADPVDGLYLIRDGEVTITKKKTQKIHSPAIFISSPTDFISKLPRKKNPVIDIKIVIKSLYEGFGGYEILSQKDSRVYSCTCSSSSCELLFIPKTSFMSRIPHMDLIRELIIQEHERLMERYHELTIPESPEKSLRSQTPAIHKDQILKYSVSPLNRLFKVSSHIQKSTRSRNSFFRRLTHKEVSEAINGRSSPMKKYGSRIHINSSFNSIHQYSSHSLFHSKKQL